VNATREASVAGFAAVVLARNDSTNSESRMYWAVRLTVGSAPMKILLSRFATSLTSSDPVSHVQSTSARLWAGGNRVSSCGRSKRDGVDGAHLRVGRLSSKMSLWRGLARYAKF
jgi:hypothetical protein